MSSSPMVAGAACSHSWKQQPNEKHLTNAGYDGGQLRMPFLCEHLHMKVYASGLAHNGSRHSHTGITSSTSMVRVQQCHGRASVHPATTAG